MESVIIVCNASGTPVLVIPNDPANEKLAIATRCEFYVAPFREQPLTKVVLDINYNLLFDVILESFGESKLNVIKVIRELTGENIAKAKEMAETPNGFILRGTRDECIDAVNKLEDAGGKASYHNAAEKFNALASPV